MVIDASFIIYLNSQELLNTEHKTMLAEYQEERHQLAKEQADIRAAQKVLVSHCNYSENLSSQKLFSLSSYSSISILV